MSRNKVNPVKNMMMPLAQVKYYFSLIQSYMKICLLNFQNCMNNMLFQLPIFLSVFVGVRQMANLPVESMKEGGILWFTDLTVPDPFWLLPLLTSATFLATIEVSVG